MTSLPKNLSELQEEIEAIARSYRLASPPVI